MLTLSDARDSLDGHDGRLGEATGGWLAGTYRTSGQDGWDGDTGFYNEARAPLLPGQTKTWMLYIWAVPGASVVEFQSHWGLTAPYDESIEARLEYVQKPSGVMGGPAVGTVWTTPPASLSLPFYSTIDGLTGYGFRFALTMVPEPSSLLALLAGLGGLGGMIWRRRR